MSGTCGNREWSLRQRGVGSLGLSTSGLISLRSWLREGRRILGKMRFWVIWWDVGKPKWCILKGPRICPSSSTPRSWRSRRAIPSQNSPHLNLILQNPKPGCFQPSWSQSSLSYSSPCGPTSSNTQFSWCVWCWSLPFYRSSLSDWSFTWCSQFSEWVSGFCRISSRMSQSLIASFPSIP